MVRVMTANTVIRATERAKVFTSASYTWIRAHFALNEVNEK